MKKTNRNFVRMMFLAALFVAPVAHAKIANAGSFGLSIDNGRGSIGININDGKYGAPQPRPDRFDPRRPDDPRFGAPRPGTPRPGDPRFGSPRPGDRFDGAYRPVGRPGARPGNRFDDPTDPFGRPGARPGARPGDRFDGAAGRRGGLLVEPTREELERQRGDMRGRGSNAPIWNWR